MSPAVQYGPPVFFVAEGPSWAKNAEKIELKRQDAKGAKKTDSKAGHGIQAPFKGRMLSVRHDNGGLKIQHHHESHREAELIQIFSLRPRPISVPLRQESRIRLAVMASWRKNFSSSPLPASAPSVALRSIHFSHPMFADFYAKTPRTPRPDFFVAERQRQAEMQRIPNSIQFLGGLGILKEYVSSQNRRVRGDWFAVARRIEPR